MTLGRRIVGLLLAVAAGIVLTPAAARAQGIVGSDPSDGAALDGAPRAVTLTFASTPDADASHVSVRDGAGRQFESGGLARAGANGLRLPVSLTGAGDYTVAYHVVLADGDEALGVVVFSVGTGAPPPAPDPATRQAAEAAVSTHEHTVDPLGGSLLVVDMVVLVGVVLLLMTKRPHRPRLEDLDAPGGRRRPRPEH